MIRFFSKIRRQLAAENQFAKYSRYAIGEVVLVMVGILFALQINNWNADRKSHNLEHGLLKEMIGNLESDSSDMAYNIDKNKIFESAITTVLNHLDNRIPYNDSLEFFYANLMGNTQLVANTSAYDNLKSQGFSLIRNDTIRMMITELYSERYPYIGNIESDLDNKYQMNAIIPLMNRYIRMDSLWIKAYPLDPESLMNNHEFKETIRMNLIFRQFVLGIYLGLQDQIVELLEALRRELEN